MVTDRSPLKVETKIALKSGQAGGGNRKAARIRCRMPTAEDRIAPRILDSVISAIESKVKIVVGREARGVRHGQETVPLLNDTCAAVCGERPKLVSVTLSPPLPPT